MQKHAIDEHKIVTWKKKKKERELDMKTWTGAAAKSLDSKV